MVLSVLVFIIASSLGTLANECQTNEDCQSIYRSKCIDNTCVCDDLSYLNSDETFCLPYTFYKGTCLEDSQCEWMNNGDKKAVCKQNKCICPEGFTWFEGECRKVALKDDNCDENLPCFNSYEFLSLKCDENVKKCSCADGYQDRGVDCRKRSSDICALNWDCLDEGEVCNLGKCVKKTSKGSGPNIEECPIDELYPMNKFLSIYTLDDCNDNSDCSSIENSVCQDKKCTCLEGYLENKGNCIPAFSECKEDEPCSAPNTICFKGFCVCKQGFFLKNGVCIGELGVNVGCKVDSDCPIKPGKCSSDGSCHCRDYWFIDETRQNCIKSITDQNKNCLSYDWCNAWGPFSFCNSDCTCSCSSTAQLDPEQSVCVKDDSSPDPECRTDSSCGLNMICKDEKCVCDSNYYEEEGKCLPKVGSSCLYEPCRVENGVCSEKVCECEQGFITTEERMKCYLLGDRVGAPCEVNEQCEKIPHAICDQQEKKCSCDETHVPQDGKCYVKKDYGSTCSTKTECVLFLGEDFECRNNVCKCKIDKTYKDGKCSSSTAVAPSLLLIILLLLRF